MKMRKPEDSRTGGTRVALIPECVKKLKEQGLEIVLESVAGAGSNHSDEDYAGCGAEIASSHQAVLGGADLIVKVMPPATGGDDGPDEVSQMKEGAALIGLLQPFNRRGMLEKLAARNLTAMSMEMVPRISRAQNMDALTSMATVGGYKAVLMAANEFQRFFPLFMTAAGTIPPARGLIL